MLKKFVSSLLAILLLAGCASGGSAASEKNPGFSAASTAQEIVKDLGLTDSMQELKQKNVVRMFFQGQEDAVTDCSVYRSTDNGNSDTAGVFVTNDNAKVKEYLDAYLKDIKAQTETYFKEEVFKISNAVVEEKDGIVILVIAEDIEKARTTARIFTNN